MIEVFFFFLHHIYIYNMQSGNHKCDRGVKLYENHLDFQICCTGVVVFFVEESSALVTTDLEISSASHAG